MFGLFRKTVKTPVTPVAAQVAMALKSLSLPQAQPSWKLYARKQDKWLPQVAIDEGYNASAVVYAAVEKRAKLVASAPWKAQTVNAQGELEDLPLTHPLCRLIKKPNNDQSWYELIYEASQSLDLAGNAFISEIRAGVNSFPTELWLLPAKNVAIKPAQEFRLVDYYEYRSSGIAGGARKRIEEMDMIQLRMPNPDDPLFGMPVLMAAGRATDIDRESGNWQKSRLQNKVASDLHVEVPDGTTPEQANEIRDRIAERQAGSMNAGKPLVTAGKVNLLSHSAVEMDFVNSRKSTWTEIAAVFGVPLAALGFTEDVNLANAEAMNKQLWHDTIIPQLELIKRQLNCQLARDFGDSIVLTYDLSNVTALQENENEKLDKAMKLWRMGVPLSVINQRFEMGLNTDEIDGADVGYIATGLLPVGFGADDTDTADLSAAEKRLIKAMCYGSKDDNADQR